VIKIKVKHLRLGDVDDPEIYLGAVAWDWFQTEHGAWCKKHATDLVYHSVMDHSSYTQSYAIVATFSDEDALIYKLRWGEQWL
jgi:hypothetical protein